MTAVLSVAVASSSTRIGSLRRNHSQQDLFIDTISSSKTPTPICKERQYSNSITSSSSAPSSPRLASHDLSNLPSFASTPASSICLQDPFFTDNEDDLQFPSYNQSPEEESTPSNLSPISLVDSNFEDHPRTYQSIGDDSDIKDQPSRHVDYLSHEWREEDVWSSWRYLVGRRNALENWERLENAAWRTWQKSRNNLPVVSPEKLNWMKEHDVTWLYGPLQTNNLKRFTTTSPVSTSKLSRVDSFMTKKSCLKKRSLSEAMLQKSISTSTLVQQAVDSLVSQTPPQSSIRPALGPRVLSDYGRQVPFTTSVPNDTPAGLTSSSCSSGAQTPSERRHIHFSEKVEQCIAINQDLEEIEPEQYEESEESEEEVLMMKPVKGKERRLISRSSTPRPSFSGDEKARTIAMLPATTLRGDTPEPKEAQLRRPSLNKSSSQETLKPTNPSSNYLWDDADDAELSWQPSSSSSEGSELESEDEEMQLKGLRRTASGMFMPYDEDEDANTSTGVFGRVIDTINTAKDIAHVVWNVGWRK